MHNLYISFRAILDNHDIDRFIQQNGPVFHRWLPNGEEDAIKFENDENNFTIKVWFERRGFVDESGFIRYDSNRKEVDESIIPRQGLLEAGALYGKIALSTIREEQLNAVINNKIGSAEYETLGKYVVKKIIDPILDRIARILRDTFGQYWIAPPSKFDSRDCSLGQYCNRRAMEWSTPDGAKGEFIPNEKSTEAIRVTLKKSNYNQYLNKESWFSFTELLTNNYLPSLSITIASRARALAGEGRIEHALIEIVTSLEIAIEEHVRNKINGNSKFSDITKGFWQLNLPARLTLISSLLEIEAKSIENALSVVTARNDFVHEGKYPSSEIKDKFTEVLNIISSLVGSPPMMFPSVSNGNELKVKAEDWERGEN